LHDKNLFLPRAECDAHGNESSLSLSFSLGKSNEIDDKSKTLKLYLGHARKTESERTQ
jgi:hypothetical protein